MDVIDQKMYYIDIDTMQITDLDHISLVADGVGAHGHTVEHECHLFLGGEAAFVQNHVRTPVRPTMLFYSRPFDSHGIEIEAARGPVNFYFIRFVPDDSDSRVMGLLERVFAARPFVRVDSAASFLCEQVRTRLALGDEHSRLSGLHLFLSFLHGLGRSAAQPGALRENAYVRDTIRIMQQRVHDMIRLDEIAGQLGVTKPHLVRLFTRHMGMPPIRYFNGLKVETARYLFRTTDTPINAVAHRLGFDDEYYFSRLFKQYTGLAPRAYRQRYGARRERSGARAASRR